MSYGNVYIRNDIKRLKEEGHLDKTGVIEEIAQKIMNRYSDISLTRARRIATRGYNARSHDWSWK